MFGWLTSWLASTALGLLSGVGQVVTKVLEHIREQQLIKEGEERKQNEIKAKEGEISIEQAKIIVAGEENETIKKMENGTF